MSITLYAKLDMTPGAVPTVVHRSQYDSDFTLVFSLYTRTGDFVIASGTTARMRGTKTSGTGYSVPITLDVSAKTVTVTGDQQMTAAAGSNIFEIVLYQGDLEICSSNFVLAIERAAMDADTITDETVVPELEHLEEYTQQAAEQAAQSASVYAESWAVGGTGTREGEDTNNAKYWSEQAQGAVAGVASFNGRTGAVVPAANDYTAAQIKRSGGTVESALQSVESVNLNQNSRLTGLENRTTTTESNITSLQNNKVDKTTPLLNFDDTATDPLTDDGALANALTALGILSDVIPAGGGTLYLKKALTEVVERFGNESTSLSMVSTKLMRGTAWLIYDKASKTCRVNFHFTANANTTLTISDILFTVPQKYRPSGNYGGTLVAITSANTIASYYVRIDSNGNITQQLGATVTAGAGYIEYPL